MSQERPFAQVWKKDFTQNNEILLEIYHVPGDKELENYLILLRKSTRCMQSCSETILARLIIKNLLEFKV